MVEMVYGIVALTSLIVAWVLRNNFVGQRYRNRFASAFLEEFKRAYPDSASLLPPELGGQIANILSNNKKLARELNALERQVAKQPEIGNKSCDYLDLGCSPETQELVTDLLKKKIELASKIFNTLPSKVQSQINRKAESNDKSVVEEELSDEGLKKDKKKDEEREKHFGLKAWRFSILMNIYGIASRANSTAS